MAHDRPTRTVLIGWDSANWEMVNPLLDTDRLPHLSRLIEQGVMGTMVSPGPVIGPMLYNSVATGKGADKHGVLGTHEAWRDGTVGKVDSLSRRTKAFWEILSQNGRRCHVVNFPATGPAEEVAGAFISPEFFRTVPLGYRAPFDVPADSVVPAERLDAMKQNIVSLEDIDAQTMTLFMPRLNELDPKDRRLRLIAASIAQTLSVHAVATRLIEQADWDVTSVNYPAIDLLWGRFLKYQPPRLDWVDPQEFELFCKVGAGAVRLCDLLLGRVVELAGEGAAIMVYSPRGFVLHQQAPRRVFSEPLTSLESVYRPEGVFVMQAPTGRKDELIHQVRHLDVCPTVLHLADVGPAEDMDGHVLAEVFVEPPAVRAVASWENVPPVRPGSDRRAETMSWPEATGFSSRFADRPAWRAQVQNDWNLVRALLTSSRRHQALPLLIRLYSTNPLQVDKAVMVAEAFFVAGQLDEAMAVMGPIAETFPESPTGQFMAGLIAMHGGQPYRALDLFESAVRDDPQLPRLFYYLGQVCLMADHLPRAMEAFTHAVGLDPGSPRNRLGLSEALYRAGRYQEAAEAAMAAVGVSFSLSAGHVALGRALAKLGQDDRARQAFETALTLSPGNPVARQHLAQMLSDPGDVSIDPQGAMGREGPSPSQAVEARQQEHTACQQAVRQARREVAQWHSRFVEDLAAADCRLDGYLTANAEARSVALPAGGNDVGGQLQETEWTVRPALPSDQPVLGGAFDDPFADPLGREVFVIHPVGVDDVRGAVLLCLPREQGGAVRLSLSIRAAGGAREVDRTGELLMVRLLRAGVARASAGGAGRVTYTLSDDDRPSPLQRCLERLGFQTTLTQVVYTMVAAPLRDRCQKILNRYKRRGKIPRDVRAVPIGDVSWRAVDQFLRQFFADGMGGSPQEICPHIPHALIQGKDLVACSVGHKKDRETFATTRIAVRYELRGGWAAPWLLAAITQAIIDDGHSMIEFATDESKFPEFVKIARHMGAERIGAMVTRALDLTAPWSLGPGAAPAPE